MERFKEFIKIILYVPNFDHFHIIDIYRLVYHQDYTHFYSLVTNCLRLIESLPEVGGMGRISISSHGSLLEYLMSNFVCNQNNRFSNLNAFRPFPEFVPSSILNAIGNAMKRI